MRATSVLLLATAGLGLVTAATVPTSAECFVPGAWMGSGGIGYDNPYPGTDLSAEDCADICRKTPNPSDCQKWTWTGPQTATSTFLANRCYILPSAGGTLYFDENDTVANKMISGLRYCPVPYGECFSANVGYGMPVPLNSADHYSITDTAEACQAWCQEIPGCYNFTWIDPACTKVNSAGLTVPCFGGNMALGTCMRYFGTNVPVLESSEGCISGPPKCPCDGQIKFYFCSHLDELVDQDLCYQVNPDNGDCDVDVAFYCPGKTPDEVHDMCDCGPVGCPILAP